MLIIYLMNQMFFKTFLSILEEGVTLMSILYVHSIFEIGVQTLAIRFVLALSWKAAYANKNSPHYATLASALFAKVCNTTLAKIIISQDYQKFS